MANYFEYNLYSSQSSPTLWDVDCGKEKFMSVFSKYIENNNKYSEKLYKEYVYGDVYYQNYNNDEIKVFRLTPMKSLFSNKRLVIHYIKQKLSLVNVPSSANYDNISYKRHVVFRISNRIFLNFLITDDASQKVTYRIYVNYNHDQNVDMTIVEKQLERIFKQVEGPTC